VLLFSKKSKTPAVYKAISAYYRDRIRFGFVSSDTQEVLAQFPEIPSEGATFPQVIVVKSYETDTQSVLESPQRVLYE
jgi:hypothetical protein